jgi:hypothetical protein
VERNHPPACRLHPKRMRQLPRSRRICFMLRGKCSSTFECSTRKHADVVPEAFECRHGFEYHGCDGSVGEPSTLRRGAIRCAARSRCDRAGKAPRKFCGSRPRAGWLATASCGGRRVSRPPFGTSSSSVPLPRAGSAGRRITTSATATTLPWAVRGARPDRRSRHYGRRRDRERSSRGLSRTVTRSKPGDESLRDHIVSASKRTLH